MKRTVAGVLLGAVAYFVWGALSWTVIPWHNATVKPLPQELLITDTMKTVIKESGFYVFPGPDAVASGDEAKAKWMERLRRGPVGAVAISLTGHDMNGALYLKQFLSNVCQAALVMFILLAARDRYRTVGCRALLAGSLGLLAGVAVHVQHRLWFSFPLGFTVVNILDLTVGFAILGAVMAKFVPEGADTR